MISRLPNKESLTIQTDEMSVRERIGFILSLLRNKTSLLFDQLFDGVETRYHVVVTLLALLEVIRLGLVKILQVENCGSLRLIGTENLLEEAVS